MNDRAEERDDESERGSADASESVASPPDTADDATTGDGESTDRPDDERESNRVPTRTDEGAEDGDAGEPSSDGAREADERSGAEGDDVGAESGDGDETAADSTADDGEPTPGVPDPDAASDDRSVPEDVRKYARFKKMDGAQYDRVNEFLRDRTYVTAREWAIARLCADFRTETGVEMTKIGENLPDLVPFMTDTYTPQAVNQARSSFDDKVRKAGATFLYGAMSDFYTAEELDDVMYEVTEVSKFLLEVEGIDLSIEDELEAEERISSVMREVREASKQLREEETPTDEADDGPANEGADESDGHGAGNENDAPGEEPDGPADAADGEDVSADDESAARDASDETAARGDDADA